MGLRRKSDSAALGSESFIDVLSNTVGALALLCIMATLDAGDLKWQLFISEETIVETKPVEFIVRGQRVHFFDRQHVMDEINRRYRAEELPPGTQELPSGPDFPLSAKVTIYESGDAGKLEVEPTQDYRGDSVEDLLAGRGAIAEQLRALDPKESHVIVHLAPDSFDRYLSLRSYCQELGLEIGWQPLEGPLTTGLSAGTGTGGGGGGPVFGIQK